MTTIVELELPEGTGRRDIHFPHTSKGTAMTLMATETHLEALRRRFAGDLIEPGDDGWDAATQAYNLTVVQEPALVAVPADEQDVVTIVDYAREHGLQVAPQRTGHNAEPLGAMDDVILVRTDRAAGRRDRLRTPCRPRSQPARSGATSSRRRPSSASPRCTARPPTSASSATRSAAVSAGTRASSASRRTA